MRKEPTELVVDLRGQQIQTLDDFWDAVAGPTGLPTWFGRNIDAWRDTIQMRGISSVIDSYDKLVIHVDRTGFFAKNNKEVRSFKRAFAGRQSQLLIQ